MENVFSYVAGAFAIIFIVLVTLLLFPFFPMLALCFVIACMLTTAIIVTLTPETDEENGVERMKA
ncbi:MULTISPECIES: hypothetical protein [Bacillaceae]|jgi:hypothetical protein|uniref:Uncharacterized protein n=1 Tax=Ectobacillus funiculus TaxID=137993 RepID=A0ABV5WH97_9BACI|nr:hypothetical protein [Ectobacillus funiculus]